MSFNNPQNPLDYMLQMLQGGVQSVTGGIQQRVGIEEQTALESGKLAQEDIRNQLNSLDAALQHIPFDDPRRGQIQQARSALAQGIGLGPKEAGKFLSGLTVPGADGKKVPYGQTMTDAFRIAQETREQREDEVRESEQEHELNLMDRQGEIDGLLQDAQFTFQGDQNSRERALKRVLQATEQAFQRGERDLDRVLQRELQAAGFDHEDGMQGREIEARKILQEMGFDFEGAQREADRTLTREENALDRDQQLIIQERQHNQEYRVFSERLTFEGDQADKDRTFQEALQSAQHRHERGEGSLNRILQKELQRRGFEFEGTERELDRELERFLKSEDITHEATQAELERDFQRDLFELNWEYTKSESGLDRDLQRSLLEATQSFERGENSLDRALQERLQMNGFVFQGDENERDRNLELLLQENSHIFEGNENALMRGLQVTLQKNGFEHATSEREGAETFEWAIQQSIQEHQSSEKSLDRALAENMQQAGFFHDMDLHEAEAAVRTWLQENELAWRATENGLSRQHEREMFDDEANLRRYLQAEELTHNKSMAEAQRDWEESMVEVRLAHESGERELDRVLERELTERGFEVTQDEAAKERFFKRALQVMGYEREDGMVDRSLAATEFNMLMEEPEDSPNWYRSVLDAGVRAGYSNETADTLARGMQQKLRDGVNPKLTKEQLDQVKFEFEQELEGIKSQYPQCASADFDNRAGTSCDKYREAIADWNTRRSQFNSTFTGTPIGATVVEDLGRREANRLTQEFEQTFPQTQNISEEAYLAEREAYIQARELNLPYKFGDGIEAEGIGFYGTPSGGLIGSFPNDAMVAQVQSDPDFEELGDWSSLNFFDKTLAFGRRDVKDLAKKYNISVDAVLRIWNGRIPPPEEIPREPSGEGGAPPFEEAPEGAVLGPGEPGVIDEMFANAGARVTTRPSAVYGSDVGGDLEGKEHKGYDIVFGNSMDPRNDGRYFPNFFNRAVEIVSKGVSASMGNYIVVRPEGSSYSLSLGHLNTIDDVEQGRVVQPGEMLARQGSTGISTGPHIDLQIIGVPYDRQRVDSILQGLLAPDRRAQR